MLSELEPLTESQLPTPNQAVALLLTSWCAAFRGHGPEAVALAERAEDIATALGDRSLQAIALHHLGVATFHDDPVRARSASLKALELHTAEGNRSYARGARMTSVLLDIVGGRVSDALGAFEAVRAESRAADDQLTALVADINLGMCHVLAGRADEAAASLLSWLSGAAKLGNRRVTAELLFDAAGVAALRGDRELAATLVGVAEAIVERTGQPLSGWEAQDHEHMMGTPLDESRVGAGRSFDEEEALMAVPSCSSRHTGSSGRRVHRRRSLDPARRGDGGRGLGPVAGLARPGTSRALRRVRRLGARPRG